MIVKNVNDTSATKIASHPFMNRPYAVSDTWVRWFSQDGSQGADVCAAPAHGQPKWHDFL